MKNRFLSIVLAISIVSCMFSGLQVSVSAYTENGFKYSVSNGKATITGIDTSIVSGDVTIPSTLGGCSVTSIGNTAFYRCTGLTSIEIPNSVMSIGDGAFRDCPVLTSITVEEGNPNYHSSGNCLIETKSKTLICGCMNSVIPSDGSVTSIDSYAFEVCSGLDSIMIPNSIISIGDYAFYCCIGLTGITIPNCVTSIGYEAFSGCAGLTSITVEEGNLKYHSSGNCLIETESGSLLTGCMNSVIPSDGSITSICSRAFYYCNGLTSIEIPNSVTYIGEWSFVGCDNLTSIAIPGSVTSIGYSAFNNTAWYDNQPDGLVYAGKIAYEYKGTMPSNTNIELKDDTLAIGDYAFSGCTGLTSIEIPDGVTSISNYAFYSCTGLTKVNYTGTIDNWCNIDFSNLSSNPLYYAHNLYINDEKVENLVIPDSVTSIGIYAFEGCTGLKSITIPNSVTSIGHYAFYDCAGPTSIEIPNSVTSIGYAAFEGCTGLTSVTIGNSVTSIGWNAFYDCTGLTDVYYTGTEQDWDNISIGWANDYLTNANIHYNYVPHTHTFGEKWSFDNTNHWYECSICGQKSNVSEHSWDSGKVTKPESCTAKGTKTYTCTVCKATKSKEIAATGHKPVTDLAVAATCTKPGKTAGKHCSVCNKVITAQTTVKAKGHTSDGGKVTTKATLSKVGTKTEKCKVCGKVLKTTSIAYPKTFSLSATSYTYDGKVKKPTVSVKDSNGKTIASSNYTVTYSSGCKNVGKYSVKITFKGNYSGTKTFTFTINPKGTTVSKLTTPKTKQIKVTIKKNTTQTTGYQIQYSTSKTFKSGNKTTTVTSNKTTSKTLTGLTKGKTYYVRVRTYKTVNGTKYYSAWSRAKSIKAK